MENILYNANRWEGQDEAFTRQLSRRRLLQLMGYGAAGVAGAGILAACGGPQKTGGGGFTVTPVGTLSSNLGTARQITPYFLGYNNIPIHSPSWNDPDVVQAATQMKPGTLRYPGGTIANYWDWRTGWFLPQAPGSFLSSPRSIYRLQELQIAVNATGAVPLYVLNMLTSDLNSQLEMLRTASSMGLPVKFIELGNEFYLSTPDDYVTKFPTGADYGSMATNWIQAIRAEFPNVQIAAVGGVPSDGFGTSRVATWTNEVLQNLQGADALTWHPYVSVQQGSITSGDATDVGEQLQGITSSRWQQFESIAQSLPSNLKIWITEYNFVDPSKQVFYKWIDGVFAAKMSLSFLVDERTELACYYDMIGKTGNEVIYYDNQGGDSSPLAPFALTAAGWSMRLLAEATHGMTEAQPITFDTGALSGGNSFPLDGWIFKNGQRQQAFLINSNSDSYTWEVDPSFSQGGTFQQLSGDPFTTVTGPGSITIKSGKLGSQLVLPAYSVTQIKQAAPD